MAVADVIAGLTRNPKLQNKAGDYVIAGLTRNPSPLNKAVDYVIAGLTRNPSRLKHRQFGTLMTRPSETQDSQASHRICGSSPQ